LADGRCGATIPSVRFTGPDPQLTLSALEEVRSRRVALDALEREIVATARHIGLSWSAIATALGVTPQSAHRRLRSLDPTSRRRMPDARKAELDELYGALRQSARSASAEGSDPSAEADASASD
jgi:hypothetical protein